MLKSSCKNCIDLGDEGLLRCKKHRLELINEVKKLLSTIGDKGN